MCPELGKQFSDFHPLENHNNLPGCFADIEPEFKLYQQGAFHTCVLANVSEHLNNVRNCMRGRVNHLVILIHGFQGNADKYQWVSRMMPKILEADPRSNVGVLVVDWRKGARQRFKTDMVYHQAAANTRYVGVATALVVKHLQADTIHCIGHSLGAHTCGFLGLAMQQDKEHVQTLDRITGLDPAGPLFLVTLDSQPLSNITPDSRLDETDAIYVDILHTDGDMLGTMTRLGHTDFYGGADSSMFGSDQACCTPISCDHSEAPSRFLATITKYPGRLTTLTCTALSGITLEGCSTSDKTPEMGYFYNGSMPGIYGVLLTNPNNLGEYRNHDSIFTLSVQQYSF